VNVLELIQHDHDEVAGIFDELAIAARHDRRTDEAARLSARLVAVARIHARAEERVVYDVMRTSIAPLKAFALAGPHEHEMLDITLDKLLVQRPSDEFRVIVKVARDLFEMHARDREEGEILPLVAEVIGPDELSVLACDMLAEQARIRPKILHLVGIPERAA